MAMIQAAESNLAPYAIRSADCGGRAHAEATDARFGPFELDRLRIVSCAAFRRLEKKTQVFGAGLDDHFRTRLTHTLEVAQTARLIATGVRVNAVLAEAVALAHDLGHPPFGHAGEKALDQMMADHDGFNHNAHSLRVVEYLE
ncbi:MAG: HD domain-containing protein, partial [Planctomycetes bacterium]|nr:HD domain-containing protein [Planctomycetota bacterium]